MDRITTRKTSEPRRLDSRRAFLGAMGIGLVAATIDTRTVLAQCVGPDVPCLTPDGIARQAFAEVFRVVRNDGKNWAISDAAIRAYVLKPIGTSDHPELDRQNPKLGPDNLPIAFRNTKPNTGEWREVERRFLFVAAEPGDPRFNGKLINKETQEDFLRIPRGANELKDRALGRLRGSEVCAPQPVDCNLNCAETVVWERQVSASDPVPFRRKGSGLYERFQTAVWSWELSEPNPTRQPLLSYTDITAEELRQLMIKDQVAPGVPVEITDLKFQMEK